jgi:threonine/homoserine/homoserine lactone efflux protein
MLPTTSLLAIFWFSFAVGFGAVVSPGPVSAAIVTQSPRRGWLVGPLVATGHSFLEFLIVILITYGLSTSLKHPNIQLIIAFMGGVLLIRMGITMIWDAWRKKASLDSPVENWGVLNNTQLIFLGVITTISNPFWYAWWVTVAAGYLVEAQSLGLPAVLAFYFGHIVADYSWDTVLSTIVGGGRKWITPAIYRGLILVCGGFLTYLGVQFILKGISLLQS